MSQLTYIETETYFSKSEQIMIWHSNPEVQLFRFEITLFLTLITLLNKIRGKPSSMKPYEEQLIQKKNKICARHLNSSVNACSSYLTVAFRKF